MTEAEITREITSWLRTLPECWYVKIKGMGGSSLGSQKTGVPDLYVCCQGRHYWFEVKTAKGKLKPSQAREIPLMRQAGALVEVVRSLEEVQAVMEATTANKARIDRAWRKFRENEFGQVRVIE